MGKSRISWQFVRMPDMSELNQFIPRMLLCATKEMGGDNFVNKSDLENYLAEVDDTGFNRLRSVMPIKATLTKHQATFAREGWINVKMEYLQDE